MDLSKKQRAIVDALEEIKARDVAVFNTSKLATIFERVIVASGDSSRQVKALADNVYKRLGALGVRVYGIEGASGADWVLVDVGDIVVHVMHPTARAYYKLEELWGARRVALRAAPRKLARAPAKRRRARA